MATKGLYPPGTVAEGDEPGLGQDLGTMLTNPSLLLTAAGILAPEESNIGGSWWRVGPRLRGLGGVMGAAREANQEQRFAGQLQKLGQQGLSPSMPPGQGGEASADPWAGMLPPGQDRQTFLSKLTPDMIRQIGANPQGYGSLVDKYAGAADSNQKKAALANAWYAQLKNTHPESVARTQALAQAEAGIHPSEKYAGTPAAELQTQLAKAQADQTIETALAGGLDTNNTGAVTSFLKANPGVDPTRLFSRAGNPVGLYAYYSDFVKNINDRTRPEGEHITVNLVQDPRTGEQKIAVAPGPIPMRPVDMQAGYTAMLKFVESSVREGSMPKEIGQAYMEMLTLGMRNPNEQQYLKLNDAIVGMRTAYMKVVEQREYLTTQLADRQVKEFGDRIAEIDKLLQSPQMLQLDDPNYAAQHADQVIQRAALQRQRPLLMQAQAQSMGATSMADLRRVGNQNYTALQKIQEDIATANMRHKKTGKTWFQVEKELDKMGIPPAEKERQKKIFLSETM